MADEGSDFTLRLVQDVTGPAKAAKQAVRDVTGGFRAMGTAADRAADQVERSWKRQVAAAKAGAAKEHAAVKEKALKEQLKADAAAMRTRERAQVKAMKQTAKSVKAQTKYNKKSEISGADVLGVAADSTMAGAVAIGAAALAGGAAVGFLGYEFVLAAEHADEFRDASVKAIGYLTDDAPHASELFDDVRKSAQGLGLGVESTVDSFKRLLAMQFDVGKSKDLIKMAADMQAIGADAEHVERILYAISEIKSMGTLQKRQERMLQMAGISGQLIDTALAKKMGTNQAGVEHARKGNKIGADVAIDAVMEAVMHKTHESELGERGAQFANTTLKGMRQQLSAGMENFWIDVGEKMDPGFQSLGKKSLELFSAIMDDPKTQEFGHFMLAEWQKFADWVDAHWPEIEKTILKDLHGIEAGFEAGAKVVEFFSDHTKALGDSALLAEPPLTRLILAVGLLIGNADAIGAEFGSIQATIGGFEDYLSAKVEAVKALASEIGDAIPQGVKDGLLLGIPETVEAVEGMADSLILAIKNKLGIHSPSAVAEDLFMQFGAGAELGVEGGFAGVASAGAGLAGAAIGGADYGSVGRGGGGRPEVNFTLQVHAQPGATREDGERMAEGIRPTIRRELISLLEELDLEAA